ncbi:MAG: tetrahydrofolate dehydrogenase/cyclohydrolase catalytic domain-containing protein [Opitutales bacterium]
MNSASFPVVLFSNLLMEVIDGNEIAAQIISELKVEVNSFSKGRPTVLFIRVGEDPASVSYVRKKQNTAEKIGITQSATGSS